MSDKTFRKYALFNWLIRLFFYGLFLAGPCFLTEAHSTHVRRQHECSLTENVNARKRIHDKYYARERLLSVIGFSCIGTWIAWLVVLLGIKTCQTVRQRTQTMSRCHRLTD